MLLRTRVYAFCVLNCLVSAACANQFSISPDASFLSWNIAIDGGGPTANPPLMVLTGSTYTFVVTTSSLHPFWIDQSPGLGGSLGTDPYPVGADLSANGVTSSTTITMNLPADAPDTLYYACANHPAMKGTILVVYDLVFRSNFD